MEKQFRELEWYLWKVFRHSHGMRDHNLLLQFISIPCCIHAIFMDDALESWSSFQRKHQASQKATFLPPPGWGLITFQLPYSAIVPSAPFSHRNTKTSLRVPISKPSWNDPSTVYSSNGHKNCICTRIKLYAASVLCAKLFCSWFPLFFHV